MNARFIIICFVLALGLGYLFRTKPEAIQGNPESTPFESPVAVQTLPKPTVAPQVSGVVPPVIHPLNAPLPIERPQATLPGKRVNPRYLNKPKDMSVEFEMINGLAVAYGDTILGKPVAGFSESRGISDLSPAKYWDHGVVPYLIKNDVVDPDRVLRAIDYFNQHTHVRFVPYENQPDAILFQVGEENCLSFLGKTGGVQPVFLSDKCRTPEITHELMHALGFVHEQSRADRDQYVEILWQNIEEKYQPQFAMVPEPLMNAYYDSPFDSGSIMMYGPHVFSINPEVNTMRLKSGQPLKSIPDTLSPSDVDRVNRLYP